MDTATMVVIAFTVAAFVGAGIVARRTRHGAEQHVLPGTYEAEIIGTDLLEDPIERASEPRIVRVFEISLLTVLMGYAFFDRGFAWLHVPGTPIFIGELLLALGFVAVMAHPTAILTAIRRSPHLKLLAMFMAWGLVLLIVLGASYGIDALRDSAIWYYGSVAFLATFLLISDPSRIKRWIKLYSRVLPWLIAWLFVAVVLDATLGGSGPVVPDSQVSIFSHAAGNSAVTLVIGLAFVWLVDRKSLYFTPSQRLAITAASGALLMLVGLKNRGGLVAGVLGIIAILMFMHKRRSEMVVTLVGVAAVLATIALVGQVSVALFSERDVSAEQFVSNITSIFSPGSGGARQTSTTEWRIELWTRVLNDVNSQFPLTGYGPGPDLGEIYNVTTNVDVPLRNPHNSHVGVIARLGWIGLGLWVAMWGVWALLLLDLRSRLARASRHSEAGLIAVLMIGAGMMLVNVFFDPGLEGPQVGMWVWFLYGMGAALRLIYHGLPRIILHENVPVDRAVSESSDSRSE